MAEEESDLESERFKDELESLLGLCKNDGQGVKSKNYCSRFCELVEEHTGRWQVPLPQLQVLQTAMCYFTHGTASFPADCEHVQFALGSLALSFFELLLFFGKDEFIEEPLKDIIDSFQDCFASLVRHKNVYLLLVNQIIQMGGPWENSVLQAILREDAQSPEEVKKYLDSEVPVFFELRVRYLLACERVQEAGALARACTQHPEVGRQMYFCQVYLTCLWKASHFDRLQKEVEDIDGRDAVEILCDTEKDEREDVLLDLSRGFLKQQLQRGDMYRMWDLVFLWSKLHLRANPSKQDFMDECRRLMMSATNVKSIFPFVKVIRDEVGNEGLHFCVELCTRALHMDLCHDPITLSLIYKTIAYLLPNDLEVCRACALLVFFLERTVESYKTVYLLYTQPDQEYHVDSSLVKNHIRFEILQVLKKGLFFDPEFWNLINLRKNCLKLMSEKVMKAALKEMMEEDKLMPSCCAKETYGMHPDASSCIVKHEKDCSKCEPELASIGPEETAQPPVKRRGRKPGSRVQKLAADSQLRRSFRQLDMAQENANRQHGSRQQRHLARQVARTSLKRRGRKPRWLLQDAARLAENGAHGRRGALANKVKDFPAAAFPERGSRKTDRVMGRTHRVSLEHRDDESHMCCVSLRDAPGGELIQPQEQVLSMSLPDDEQVIPVHGTMLEFSLPDNEFMDSLIMDCGVESSEHRTQQDSTGEDDLGIQKAPVEHPLADLCKREIDSSLAIQNPSELLKAEVCEELAIELHIATIRELHNYSRILEETSGVCLRPLPATRSPMQHEGECNPNKSEDGLLEKHSMSFQTSDGMEACSPLQADIAKSVVALGVNLLGPEGESCLEFAQIRKTSEVCMEHALPDDGGIVSREKTVANGVLGDQQGSDNVTDHTAAAHKNTDCTSENTRSGPVHSTVNASHVASVPSSLEATETCSAPSLNARSKMGQTVLKHRCMVCDKEFRGGNVMRHAVAHLQRDKLKCMFCTKVFRCRLKAKRHVAEHVEQMKNACSSGPVSDGAIIPVAKDTVLPCDRMLNCEPKDTHHQEHVADCQRVKLKANGTIEVEKVPSEEGEFHCPADGCEKTFARAQWSLIRHAMKFHPNDAKVLEYTFSSRKGQCHFCKRKFLSLLHYQDHIRGHSHPLRHACLHHDCRQRFKTQVELRGHMRNHQPFQAQCSFPGCPRRFGHLGQLFEHELRHYQPPKVKDVSMDTASEVWTVRGKGERKDSQEASNRGYVWRGPLHHKADCKAAADTMVTNSETKAPSDTSEKPVVSEYTGSAESSSVDAQLVNGHRETDGDSQASDPVEGSDEGPQRNTLEDGLGSMATDQIQRDRTADGQEPAAQGWSAAKAADRCPYGGTSNKPFVRLSPSAYLDEKYISMPKRRKPLPAPSPSSVPLSSCNDEAQKQRCAKCFITFSSVEELKSHLSSNKCTALFGFESDEEGA